MGFFVIAVILIICGIVVWIFCDDVLCAIPFMLAFLALSLALFANWGGYDEPIVSNEYKLIPLVEETDIYLIESDDGTKMIKYKIPSKHDKDIENVVIKKVRASVDIEYISEDLKPVIREYVCKPKKSLWNGKYADDKQYSVLFVPESYILK